MIPPCNDQLLWSTSNPTVNKLEIPAWLIGGHFISIQRRRTHQYVYQTVPLNDQPRMVLVLFLQEWTGDICSCIVGVDSMILICEGKLVISSLLFLNSDGIYW